LEPQSRIFVVEDEPLVAETIVSALGDEYRVTACGDAAEALQRLGHEGADLVILDLLLPGGRAGDVIAWAQAKSVPVILMTGDIERAETMRVGNQDFLSKPFSIDDLLAAVATALRL
jgi:DNA-binding response OmpR family regulator